MKPAVPVISQTEDLVVKFFIDQFHTFKIKLT